MFQSHHQWLLPPTIGIRAPFIGKQKSFGVYPNFRSCQKQVLIIPQCRSHQDELTAARISLIGDGGSPHAPPEDPVTVSHARHICAEPSRTRRVQAAPQAESSRATSRAVLRAEPSRVSSRSRAREYSPNIPGSTQRTARRTELVFGPVHPFSDPISTKSDRFPTI